MRRQPRRLNAGAKQTFEKNGPKKYNTLITELKLSELTSEK
jgi:hypothetical protein